jgi:hypothetical protein
MAGVTSSYPAALDSESNLTPPNNGDTLSVADHWLAGNSGPIVAIETELGTDPAGSHTNVKDRLDQVDSAMGFKNRIIGGNFSTNPWQRGTSFTGPADTDYTADRFKVSKFGVGVFDIDKTAEAPTIAEADVFTQHCLHADVTTIDNSIAASDLYAIQHVVEGYNLLDLGFGQSGTRYITLSFWHKHTVTGTYSVAFSNSALNRSYIAEYTQSTTNTWEKAELTIPVDTTGTWLYDNNAGLRLYFAMATGSTYAGAAGSWSANDYRGSTNQVNALATLGNDFKIALVQLEAGDKATPFETRSVGQELELCLRYYNRIATGSNKSLGMGTAYTTNNLYLLDHAPVPMRAVPTIDQSSGTNHFQYYSNNATFAFNSFTGVNAASTEKTYSIYYTGSGFTGGSSGLIRTNNSSAYFGLAAEL